MTLVSIYTSFVSSFGLFSSKVFAVEERGRKESKG